MCFLTVICRLHSADNETVNWLEQTAMKLAKRNEFDESHCWVMGNSQTKATNLDYEHTSKDCYQPHLPSLFIFIMQLAS